MSSERNRSGCQQHEREGANSVAALRTGTVCNSDSQLRSSLGSQRCRISFAPSVVVPSLGAQLRSSLRDACISSRRAVPSRHIASRSQAAWSRRSISVRGCPLPNKRFELTAQRLAPLGSRSAAAPAAQPRRWAAESNMSSERNRSRYQRHEREGASGVVASCIGAVCSSASQLRPASLATRRMSRVAPSVVVPWLGAQLRSSAQGAHINSRHAVPCSRIASLSQPVWSRRGISVRACPLPNKRFVLTAQRLAPFGPRSAAAPAAQPGR